MGALKVGPYIVNVGRQWETHHVTAIKDGNHVAIFSGTRIVRVLDIDPTRRYQPGHPRPQARGIRQPHTAQ